MKSFLSVFLLVIFVNNAFAQNPNIDYMNAVKVYNLSTYEKHSRSRGDTSAYSMRYTTTHLQLLHPSIAFQWKTAKNNFHEIELTNLSLGKTGTKNEIVNDTNGQVVMAVSANEVISSNVSGRYEYQLNFRKSKDVRLVPALGLGVMPYFRFTNYTSGISTIFPATEYHSGLRTFITPRLTYYFSSRIFFDINIPLCFSDGYLQKNKSNDPALPGNQRSITTVNFELFPKVFSGRFGFGLKI